MSKRNGTTARRKTPADPVLFQGEIITSTEPLARREGATNAGAALVVKWAHCPHPVLVINSAVVSMSSVRLIELWARRMLGAGHRFKWLTTDDLYATGGLFAVAA